VDHETILAFHNDVVADPDNIGYSKEIVMPLIDEIISLKEEISRLNTILVVIDEHRKLLKNKMRYMKVDCSCIPGVYECAMCDSYSKASKKLLDFDNI